LHNITTTVTLKIYSPELGHHSFPLAFDTSKQVVKDLGLLRLGEAIERLDELEGEIEDLAGEQAAAKKKEALRATPYCSCVESALVSDSTDVVLASNMGIATSDTSFWANEKMDKTDKTPEEKNIVITLASVTDLDERDRPVTVRRYDIKYLLQFQEHYTDRPRIDTPWEKLVISRTAPELTNTPDKKGAGGGGVRSLYFSCGLVAPSDSIVV